MVKAEIAFICVYIFFFATTWDLVAWVMVGKIFPLHIRSRGVALPTASNWLGNCIIAVITPYMVGQEKDNLGAKVFFAWGTLCVGCFLWTYSSWFLRQRAWPWNKVDGVLEEPTPRTSSKWVPTTTFPQEVDMSDKKDVSLLMVKIV
jgi:SP family sugar:H+ symporter-like MFS transporter